MKYCINCGAMMPKEARFCPVCGKEQVKTDQDSISNVDNTYNKNKHSKISNHLTTNQQLLIESKINNESKSIGVAYLLWWFFGWLGAQRFYLHSKLPFLPPILFFVGWIFVYTPAVYISFLMFFIFVILWISDAINIPKWINSDKKHIKTKLIDQINPNIKNQQKQQQHKREEQQRQKELEYYKNNHQVKTAKNGSVYIQDKNKKVSSTGIFFIILVLLIIFFIGCSFA